MPDPAAGTFEFPGGHCEGNETPRQAALREWQEETGLQFPDGEFTGTWTSPNGIYQGFVYAIATEADLDIFARQIGSDPDGDGSETIAWWDPADLPGNRVVRPELLADIDAVMAVLGCGGVPDCCGADCCAGGCCNGDAGCTCGPAGVAKAATSGPKVQAGKWPGWRLADQAAAWWTPLILAAAASALTPAALNRMAADYQAAFPGQDGAGPGKQARNDAAYAWLVAWLAAAGVTIGAGALAAGILADGYLIGAASAAAMVAGGQADTGAWQPGDTQAAQDQVTDLGEGDALAALLTLGAAAGAAAITAPFLHALSRVLAGASGAVAAVAAALAAVTADDGLAESIALDQLYSSAGTAALDYYPGRSTGDFSWEVDPTLANCVLCLGNADAEPRPLGEPWPSGDTEVSIHFKCGCMLCPA